MSPNNAWQAHLKELLLSKAAVVQESLNQYGGGRNGDCSPLSTSSQSSQSALLSSTDSVSPTAALSLSLPCQSASPPRGTNSLSLQLFCDSLRSQAPHASRLLSNLVSRQPFSPVYI